jgi:hypothetical protein
LHGGVLDEQAHHIVAIFPAPERGVHVALRPQVSDHVAARDVWAVLGQLGASDGYLGASS